MDRPVEEPAGSWAPASEPVGSPGGARVDLFWIPLGAGGAGFVRANGRVYEWIRARRERRPRCDLYHSALEVHVPGGRFVIEMTPIRDDQPAARGVVVEGPVGSRWLGRLTLFRYEMRRWRDGSIPDVAEAVASPTRLSEDGATAHRLLALVGELPVLVWGRDELRTGDMWNSNSAISWLLAQSGLPAHTTRPPAGGRAPGWQAGIEAALRSPSRAATPTADPVSPASPASPVSPEGRLTRPSA